jgi:hypothetical protein
MLYAMLRGMSFPFSEAAEIVAILIKKHDGRWSDRCVCSEIRAVPQIEEALARLDLSPAPSDPHKMRYCALWPSNHSPGVKF